SADDLARQATLCEPPPRAVRVRADALEPGKWRVEFVAPDRVGLLARETAALSTGGLDVRDAIVATWSDRVALASFIVHGTRAPDAEQLADHLQAALLVPLAGRTVPDARVDFDNDASPWHTVCQVEGADRAGLLRDLTTAFALCGA